MDTVTEDTTATTPDDTSAAIYRWSTWVHVGPDAEGCDHRETGTCQNPAHFHAWCRLPNPFQHREIRETALAARARLTRRLRDEDTDAGAILTDEVDQLRRLAERSSEDATAVRESVVEDLVSRDWYRDYADAMADLAELEDDKTGDKPFEFIERDQERYRELAPLPEDERPAEEFAQLETHLTDYGQRLQAAVEAGQAPRREALFALGVEDLLEMIREDRIKAAADEEFDHVYGTYSWLHCTARSKGGERWFDSLDALKASAPEVVDALKAAYDDLELARRKGASGKS